jgi:hypothetical protein
LTVKVEGKRSGKLSARIVAITQKLLKVKDP